MSQSPKLEQQIHAHIGTNTSIINHKPTADKAQEGKRMEKKEEEGCDIARTVREQEGDGERERVESDRTLLRLSFEIADSKVCWISQWEKTHTTNAPVPLFSQHSLMGPYNASMYACS